METDVIVAIITGAIALLVAILGSGLAAYAAWRGAGRQAAFDQELEKFKDELERGRHQYDQELAAIEVFDSYRKPLLHSALELQRRLGNIQQANFGGYLEQEDRRGELARRTTLYRLASYLGWREIIIRDLTFLEDRDDLITKKLIACLEDVGTQLANDWVHGIDFMLWKDEQRAIGGLMIREGTPTRIIGFEIFEARYTEVFSRWLGEFEDDLGRRDLAEHRRLIALSESLGRLVTALDRENLHAVQQ